MKKDFSAKVLMELFLVFAKIGTFAFGGGYVMVPMIQKEASESHDWVPKEKIGEVIAISSSMPGAIAMNTSVYVGYLVSGVKGAIIALMGCILPAILLTLVFIALIVNFQNSFYFQAAMKGVIPVVTALMVTAIIKLCKTNVKNYGSLIICILSIIMAVLFTIFKINIIYILILCSLIGLLFTLTSLSSFAMTAIKKKE